VTWQTDIPSPHVIFDASAQLSRRGDNPFVSAEVDGGSRRRYRLRLRGVFDTIELRAIRDRPPYDSRRVVVDVSG
jgi:hypothetical protein